MASRDDGWHCPICLDSFERPVLASCCGQSFCRSCLDAALRQLDACPMCRSPLLSGPFAVTPNRSLQEALAALASAPIATSSSVAAKNAVWERNSAPEVQISLTEVGNSQLIQEEQARSCSWRETLRVWRVRSAATCRRRSVLSTQSAELRRRLRQWNLWCRVNWTSLQCVFYVLLFFVFVFFLRVQEEEFADSPNHLRRPH